VSVPDDIVALVEASEEHAVEVDGPDPVIDFLQADVVLFEGVGDEQQPVLEAKGAGVGDALDQEVAGVLERGQVLGIGAWGHAVAITGRAAAQVLVRPFVVVLAAERVEGTLLGRERAAGCWMPSRSHQTLSCERP